jgi:hypothetical protein
MTKDQDHGVAKAAAEWLDEALRSGFTHIDEIGLHWLWVDDVPEGINWPSYLEVSNYLHELEVPISGSHGSRTYEGSDRVAYTRKVIIPWEYLGRLIEVSPFLRDALAKVLAGPS